MRVGFGNNDMPAYTSLAGVGNLWREKMKMEKEQRAYKWWWSESGAEAAYDALRDAEQEVEDSQRALEMAGRALGDADRRLEELVEAFQSFWKDYWARCENSDLLTRGRTAIAQLSEREILDQCGTRC